MTTTLQRFSVQAKGVGRVDYSSAVEAAVESTIRSYQEAYSAWANLLVPAGDAGVEDFVVPSGYVAIAYDFYATFPANTMATLLIQTVDDGVPYNVAVGSDYGSIRIHVPKGFPFTEVIRFNITNYGPNAITFTLGAMGVQTDLPRYTLLTPS